jgi:hypothetical protein
MESDQAMRRRARVSMAGLAFLLGCFASIACRGDTIYASATAGTPHGIVIGPTDGGYQYGGVRFELTERYLVEGIGGYFQSLASNGSVGTTGNGQVFGALVKLTSFSDLPDSSAINTPDVLETTLIQTSTTLAEVTGNVNVTLDAGIYGIIFGSGRFGASGFAVAKGAADIGSPSFFSKSPVTDTYNNGNFGNVRFVVQGVEAPAPVPLPAPVFAGIALFSMIGANKLRRRLL